MLRDAVERARSHIAEVIRVYPKYVPLRMYNQSKLSIATNGTLSNTVILLLIGWLTLSAQGVCVDGWVFHFVQGFTCYVSISTRTHVIIYMNDCSFDPADVHSIPKSDLREWKGFAPAVLDNYMIRSLLGKHYLHCRC